MIYTTLDGSDPTDPANTSRQVCTQGAIEVTDRSQDANVLSAVDPILFDSTNVEFNEEGAGFISTVKKPADNVVDKCTIVKAAVKYSDGTYSDVKTNTYFVGAMAEHIQGIKESCAAAGMDLSVVSISMDASDLFDQTKGIYVKGDIFDKDRVNMGQ